MPPIDSNYVKLKVISELLCIKHCYDLGSDSVAVMIELLYCLVFFLFYFIIFHLLYSTFIWNFCCHAQLMFICL